MSFTVDFKRHGIGALHDALAAFRATPEDIARHCIEHYEGTEGSARAWVAFDGAQLLAAARAAASRLAQGEALRGLEAVPVGVKDIFNTTDFPTQMGSPLWEGFTPGNDARAVFNLKRAGGLVPGKTVTAEFAVHTLGKTLNPWAPERTPGTSSSGSAVAVALGVVPAALGTQTAGSIVRPASFCGVWGMKPSFGLIPRTGMLKTTDSLDTVGFFAGHAADLSRLFDALRVHGRDYPISDRAFSDAARQQAPQQRPWRVGFVRPHVWQHAPGHAQVALVDWLRQLQADKRFDVVSATLPEEMAECHPLHATIYNRALAYYFKQEYQSAGLVSPVMNALIDAGNRISAASYAAALARQVELARLMDRYTRDFDVLVTLSTAGEAPLRHVEERPDSALMWTLTQLPAVSAPVFKGPRALPFGLQIVARRYNDPLLLKFVAEAVQRGHLPASSFAQTYGLAAGVPAAAADAASAATSTTSELSTA
jgi:Asp-tRNA(Asn)/Glu-tRNA(Gln) amidotransferase A subunit family amidase